MAFMKAVHHKVNIVPVIAKADTLTKKEVLNQKKKVSSRQVGMNKRVSENSTMSNELLKLVLVIGDTKS